MLFADPMCRHQLDHAFIINQLLQAKLEEEAVRADSATADALRVGRTAANLSKQVQALKHRLQHGEGLEHGDMADGTDSAFHMDGTRRARADLVHVVGWLTRNKAWDRDA